MTNDEYERLGMGSLGWGAHVQVWKSLGEDRVHSITPQSPIKLLAVHEATMRQFGEMA